MENQSLEDVFKNLDNVVKQLEGADVSLEESFQLYYKGMELLKTCNEKIDNIEKKLLVLDGNGELHEL